MPGTNEAFSRVKIDAQLKDRGWYVLDPDTVRFEYVLPDRTEADYVLCDRHGRALAVIEAKKAAINRAEAQARAYAAQFDVPYVFLANGGEIRFWEWRREAFPRAARLVKPISTQRNSGPFEFLCRRCPCSRTSRHGVGTL